ncbi:MAG: hypothetical protein ABDH61_02560 [Acidilobaceae archaeon]
MEFAARAIEDGKILAVKGVGGYHIAALTSDEVVRRLRKPLAATGRTWEIVLEARRAAPGTQELLT